MAQSNTIITTAILLIFCAHKIICFDITDLDNSEFFACSLAANASISFQNNVNILFSDFISHSQSSIRGYYNTSVIGDRPNSTVYGYYLCRVDISPKSCRGCILNATQSAQKAECLYQDGIFYSSKCMLRYANHSMYGVWDPGFTFSYSSLGIKVSNPKQFDQTLSTTIEALINDTDNGSGFATKEANVFGDEKIYSLAQCTPDIVGTNCTRCLRVAMSDLRRCCDGFQGGMSMYPNCQLIYSNQSFYNLKAMGSSNGEFLRPPCLLVIYFAFFLFMYFTYILFD